MRRLSAIAALLVLLVLPFFLGGSSELRFVAFDVGQGDALFIEAPAGYQVLIDGGPSTAVLARLGRVLPYFDHSLDLVILTHPDADHLTGLVEVAERYDIGTFVMTGVAHGSATYAALNETLLHRHVPVHLAVAGDVFDLGGATLTVLWPRESVAGEEVEKVNDTSIVARLDYGTFSALLTGDIESSVEASLVAEGANLQASILKAPHHGSKTSSTSDFLDAVQPKAVLISVGRDNRYGHPHPDVLQRYEERSMKILRTDERGDVVIESDGTTHTTSSGLGFRLW